MIRIKKDSDFYPLVNRYEPKNINKLILTNETRIKINNIIINKSINNTVICGPNGVGKTIMLKLLIKDLLGEFYKEGEIFLDFTTSKDRGLKNMTEVLPEFCDRLTSKYSGKKIILIDEADNLTKKAQSLIINIMEEYHDKIVFIFTCNDNKKLSEAILSRCMTIYMPLIDRDTMTKLLENISIKENFNYTLEGLELISTNSNGDVRSALNLLDIVSNGFDVINETTVRTLLYKPSAFDVDKLLLACVDKDMYGALNIMNNLHNNGFSNTDILLSFFDVVDTLKISNEIKILFSHIISIYYTKMSNGLDSNLQIYGCISDMVLRKK